MSSLGILSVSNLRKNYQLAIQAIIRPERQSYHQSGLGPQFLVTSNGKSFRRVDQQIVHPEEIIELSAFLPYDPNMPFYVPSNMILFCHCNSSNRLECMQYLDFLPKNYGIASFDFIGCGNSKGQYVTLGIKQSQQIRLVIRTLQNQYGRVILWGRSMGAVSSLMYGQNPITVVDSPFYSLKKLSKDKLKKLSNGASCVLNCFFPCLWDCIENDVKRHTNVDINSIDTSQAVRKMNPNHIIIFVAAINDQLVHYSQIQKLFHEFPGQRKALLYIKGDHYSPRDASVFKQVMSCIETLQMPMAKLEYSAPTISSLWNIYQT